MLLLSFDFICLFAVAFILLELAEGKSRMTSQTALSIDSAELDIEGSA